MTLQRITIAGYKAYPELVEIDLKPLTLLYGENSTGKSSLMRLLPLLQETLKNPTDTPLTLSSNLTKSANLADLFSAHRNDGVIELSLQFDGAIDRTTIEYKFKNLERGDVVLLEFSLIDVEHALKVELDLSVLSTDAESVLRYVDRATRQEVVGLHFNGIIPVLESGHPSVKAGVAYAGALLHSMKCNWLAPLRAGVPRIGRIRTKNSEIGAFGEGCVDVLYADFMNNGPVFRDVTEWFETNCSASLQVVPGAHEFGALAGLALVRQGKMPVRIPLEDCGEGITQVLPVLVLVALAKHGRLGRNPVIVLEHPDLHLHSNAHYGIIQYIVAAIASEYNPRFLVESHAEPMLIAAQLQVVNGELSAANISALHIRETDQGHSVVDHVEFETNGSAKGEFSAIDWFDQTNSRALRLAKKMVGLS